MAEPIVITVGQAEALICNTNGHIFGCRFVKRTDGVIRLMVGRLGVTRYLNGAGRRYEPEEYGLVDQFVYDVLLASKLTPEERIEKPPYRAIPVDGILSVTYRGRTYLVEQFVDLGQIRTKL